MSAWVHIHSRCPLIFILCLSAAYFLKFCLWFTQNHIICVSVKLFVFFILFNLIFILFFLFSRLSYSLWCIKSIDCMSYGRVNLFVGQSCIALVHLNCVEHIAWVVFIEVNQVSTKGRLQRTKGFTLLINWTCSVCKCNAHTGK